MYTHTSLEFVSFRDVCRCDTVVTINPAKRWRCAVLWTGNCHVH